MRGLAVSLLSRLWPWRVGLGLVVLALVAISAIAQFYRDHSVELLILRAMDRAPRIAAGLSLAHERLTTSALEVQSAAAPPSHFARDLEAFHAAIAALEGSDQRGLFADLPRFAAVLERLRAFRSQTSGLWAVGGEDGELLSPVGLSTLLGDLARLREPLDDLADGAIARQRLEIVRLTRELRQAERISVAASVLAVLLGGLLVLAFVATPPPVRPAAPLVPSEQSEHGLASLLVAQAGNDLASALHRTIGRLGLLVGMEGAAAEPLQAGRQSAEAALETVELLTDAALLAAGRRVLQRAPFDPERVLQDALRDAAGRCASVRREGGTPRLWLGDARRFAALARAVVRVCTTAEAAPPCVRLSAGEGGLVLTVGEGGEAPFESLDSA